MLKKIVSYSLYGFDKKYTMGAIANAKEIQSSYPNWVARFYIGKSVPDDVVSKLKKLNAEVIYEVGCEDPSAMFWRFQVFSDPEVSHAIIRDCDSRILKREVMAVNEWLCTGLGFHIMRDHPFHNVPMLGGMWGAQSSYLRDIKDLINSINIIPEYNQDQLFLKKHIYPKTKNNVCVHDSFFFRECNAKQFTIARFDSEYVGEVINANESILNEHYSVLKRYESNRLLLFYLKIKSLLYKFIGR